MSLQLYDQIQAGVLLPIQVNGSALPPGIYPRDISQQVAAIYNSPAGCGQAPGTPFSAEQLYFSTPIGGVKRIYQGGELTGYATFGDLVVQPYYNVTVSKAISDSPLLHQSALDHDLGQPAPQRAAAESRRRLRL